MSLFLCRWGGVFFGYDLLPHIFEFSHDFFGALIELSVLLVLLRILEGKYGLVAVVLFCIFQNLPLFLIPEPLPLFQTVFPFLTLENIPFACLNPSFGQLLGLHEETLLVFGVNPHQFKCILDEILLDHVIQRRSSLKRRRVINLDHNGLKIIHNHNIKP